MNAYDVLDFLKNNPDTRFKSYIIAKKFGVSTQTMVMTLTALGNQIESDISGKTREFWYMSEDVRKQRQAREAELQSKIAKTKRVYKMPQSLIDALARAREGRSDDFGYVTIS